MKCGKGLWSLVLAGMVGFSTGVVQAEPLQSEEEYFDVLFEVLQDLDSSPQAVPVKRQELLRGLETYIESHEIVKYASLEIGKPYVYGAKGPEAYDCSGLMYHIFAKAGKKIPRTSAKQGEQGTLISREELKTGDLIFFDTRSVIQAEKVTPQTEDEFQEVLFALPTTSEIMTNQAINYQPERVTHVGIYVGDDKFIHAASDVNKGVVVDSLKTKYYDSRYLFAKRYQ